MSEQIGLHINMTANMSVVTAQMQALTAGVMETTAAYRMLDRSMDNIKFNDVNRQFANLLTSSGQFNHQMVTLQSSTEGYGKALEAGRVSGRKLWTESLMYARKQSGEIKSLAREQVAFSRSQMMMTGRLASGAATASIFTPAGVGTDQVTQMQLANKQWEIFNRNAQLGATAMVNWGKNTQWAGRQLMVGFTVPLMIMGGMAAKTFKELDQELVRLQKVYGSGLTFGDDFVKQSQMIREEGKRMAEELAAAYGQAGTETVALMADLAAAGYEGQDLTKLTTATTKLSLLGEIDKQESMKATISLQTAFGLSTDQVAEKVLFLNAVENQTSTSLGDLVEAIPRAGTVIEGLGGSVEDLALYMTAFREGGVSAAEGANALKSGLSSIIAPPKAAVEFMKEFGINLPKMVKQNAGDLTGTLIEFQGELQKLDDLAQQQVITKLFGKYQFARMNAFFNNLGAQGSQTLKVMELMGYSTEQLGQIANQELESITESVSGKFNRSWQSFKMNLMEVGEVFLKVGTVALDVFNKVFGFFEGKDLLRNIAIGLAGVAAVIGPIIMSLGLFGNMLGMMLKGILRLTNGFKVMASGGGIKRTFELLTAESMAANASIDIMTNNMFDQQKADAVLADANKWLAESYDQIANSAARAATAVGNAADRMRGGMMVPPGQVGAAMPLTYTRGQHGPQLAGIPMQYGHHMPLTADARQQEIIRRVFTQPGGIAGTNWPAGLESLGDKERPYLGGVLGGSAITAYGNKTGGSQIQYFSDLNVSDADKFMNANEMRYSKVNSAEFFAEKSALMQSELGVSTAEAEAWVERWTAHLRELDQSTLTLSQAQELTVMSLRDAENVVEKSTGTTAYTGRSGSKTRGLSSGPDEKLGQRPEQIGILGGSPGNSVLEEDRRVWRETAASVAATSENLDGVGVAAGMAEGELAALDTSGTTSGLETLEAQTKQAAADIKRVAVGSQEQTANVTAFNKAWSSNAKGATNAFIATTAQQKAMTASMSKMTGEFTQTSMTFDKIQTAGTMYIAAFDKATGELIGIRGFDKSGRVTASINPAAQQKAEEIAAQKMLAVAEESARIERQASEAAAQRLVDGSKVAGQITVDAAETSSKIGIAGEETESKIGIAGEQTEAKIGVAGAATGGIAGGGGGFLSNTFGKFKSAGAVANVAGGASMLLPMAGMMMAPQGSNVQSISQMASLGSMAGMFGGPWGMAAGTAAGAAVGGAMALFKALKEESDRLAQEAADNWEGSMANLELDDALAKSLGIKNFNDPVKLNFQVGEFKTYGGDKFRAEVETNFATEIEQLNKMTDAQEKLNYSRRIYARLIASGMTPEDAAKNIGEMLRITEDVGLIGAATEKFKNAAQALSYLRQQESQTTANIADRFTEQSTKLGKATRGAEAFSKEEIATISSTASELGESYWKNFMLAIEAGDIKPTATAFAKRLDTLNESIATGLANDVQWGDTIAQVTGDIFKDSGIDVKDTNGELKSFSQILAEVGSASDATQAKLADALSGYPPLQAAVYGVVNANNAFINKLWEANPAIASYAQELMRLTGASEQSATALALLNSQLQKVASRRQTSFVQTGVSMLPEEEKVQKVNIDKLRRQEDARIEGMQEAAEAQEEAMQDEIDAVSERYDKEIDKIQQAEEKRQEAFDKEQERFARRQEMRNMEISYQEALAEGNLFEASRIRMDINATRKQHEAESKRERQSDRANKKVEALEKEKDKKISLMEEALEAEQKANEEAIEAAQKAADQKIRIAEKQNKQVADDYEEHEKDMTKLYNLMLNGRMKKFREYAEKIGLGMDEQNRLIAKWTNEEFSNLPGRARDAVAKALQSGNWGILYEMINAAINGASKEELKYMYSNAVEEQWLKDNKGLGGNQLGGAMAAVATGGYISGPGGPTTDSIPAWLSNGEYVVRAASVKKYGKGFMDKINDGDGIPEINGGTGTFAEGGMAGTGFAGGISSGIMSAAGDTLINIMQSMLKKKPGADDTGPTLSIPAISSAARRKIVEFAADQIGEPYVFGAAGPNSWDCSGLTMMAYALANKSLPHAASQQYLMSKKIDRSDAMAGDMAFFNPGTSGAPPGLPGHVGIMAGKDAFIHAANPDLGVVTSSLSTTGNEFVGIGRIPGLRSGGKINYDNTLANLHRGETVLTAPLTNKLEQSLASAGETEYNINVTIHNPSSNIDIERALLNVMSKNERRMGRNRVIK